MTCDDVLTYALAPGPRPAEVEGHLRRCGRCSSELEALRRLEGTLGTAAPPLSGSASMEAAVVSRVIRPRQMGRVWLSAAAALLVAFALATAWFGHSVRPEAPAPSPALSAAAFHTADEDSTAGLLQAYELYAADLPQVQADDLSGYLSPTDQGGWNG
jgi:hypothetical protein